MFVDRYQAGELLSQKLQKYKGEGIVLSIPRGGVVVGKVVSKNLNIPHEIVVTKKIPAKEQPELAIGAVGGEGVVVFDSSLVERLNIDSSYLTEEVERVKEEVEERIKKFSPRGPLELSGKTVVLVDDGIATGATVEAAIKYLRKKNVAKIVLAIPVIPRDAINKFRDLVDELVFLETPEDFHAVGQFYQNFPQVTDEEVIKLLQ